MYIYMHLIYIKYTDILIAISFVKIIFAVIIIHVVITHVAIENESCLLFLIVWTNTQIVETKANNLEYNFVYEKLEN